MKTVSKNFEKLRVVGYKDNFKITKLISEITQLNKIPVCTLIHINQYNSNKQSLAKRSRRYWQKVSNTRVLVINSAFNTKIREVKNKTAAAFYTNIEETKN